MWCTHTAVLRAVESSQVKYKEFKKQTEKYQLQVKDHWGKTEMYMSKLRSKYDESKQKRDAIKLDLQNVLKEQKILISDHEESIAKIYELEAILQQQGCSRYKTNENPDQNLSVSADVIVHAMQDMSAATLAQAVVAVDESTELQKLRFDLSTLQQCIANEQHSKLNALQATGEVLDVLSEYQQWDNRQQEFIDQLAAKLLIEGGRADSSRGKNAPIALHPPPSSTNKQMSPRYVAPGIMICSVLCSM